MSSPLMTQYQEIKAQYPDDILFFRLGDFYEMFGDDARVASKALDVVLTRRQNTVDGEIPMCGVPYHSAQNYIGRLINQGYSVAICEQIGDPKTSKGIVKREVTKVITPGTVMLESALSGSEHNFISAILGIKNYICFALADITTGVFLAGVAPSQEAIDILETYRVREVISMTRDMKWKSSFRYKLKWNEESKWNFEYSRARDVLMEHFGTQSMEGFGFEPDDRRISVAGALLHYLQYTQKADLKQLHQLKPFVLQDRMRLDSTTLDNLEILMPSRVSERSRSVFEILNETKNPMGARLLRSWLLEPLTDLKLIHQRQSDVGWMIVHEDFYTTLREITATFPDLERVLARLVSGNGGPRDLGLIRSLLQTLNQWRECLPAHAQIGIKGYIESLRPLEELLERALQDSLPLLIRDGGFVKHGYREDIDTLLNLSQGGKDWLVTLQEQERSRTGISNLKIGFNKVFGYYLEVSKSYLERVPREYIKKQTLTNAERFVTEEIKQFEENILSAEHDLLTKELEVWQELIQAVSLVIDPLQKIAQEIAYYDVIQGFAYQALYHGFVCPVVNDSHNLMIVGGRHPVVERLLGDQYVSNDIRFDHEHSFMLITGPNMAGKSTYIRQIALIVLLAQIGSYVPANEVQIGLVDRIFTRVGASDNLSEGQSTFMVEMVEVANILRNATDRSLVILDEVGRGTSTYDGISIAKALCYYIHDTVRARTLFATHYHELLSLEQELDRLRNYRVTVHDAEREIIFLHTIEPGGTAKSYGIAIAKLAGFPTEVVDRAYEHLEQYEKSKHQLPLFGMIQPAIANDTSLSDRYNQLREAIKSYSLESSTPLEAMNHLAHLQQLIQDDDL